MLSVPDAHDTATFVTLDAPTVPLALLIGQVIPGVCDFTVTSNAPPPARLVGNVNPPLPLPISASPLLFRSVTLSLAPSPEPMPPTVHFAPVDEPQPQQPAAAARELGDAPVLNNWDRLLDYLTVAMAHRSIEEFRVLYLDNRNRLIADEIASRGTVNHTQVYVREVVKRALEKHATALILVHNHPSGETSPSRDDIEMTREVERAAATMEIVVHDHLIIGKGRWTSLRREGLMAGQ